MSTDPLAAAPHPALGGLLIAALGLYVLAALVTLVRPGAGRPVLGAALLAHASAMVGRGLVVDWLPMGRMDSFATAAAAFALVALLSWRPRRAEILLMLGVVIATLGVALAFPQDLRYAPPILRTVWYPLHVPSSFVCYGLWFAAGAAGVQWWMDRDPTTLRRMDQLALVGFGLWTVSMVFGGIWGAVAWGAWFLWDPKFIWSVILWFHYVSLLHLRLTPSLFEAHRLRVALTWLGCAWVLVAWVGTSFFFGKSTHAF